MNILEELAGSYTYNGVISLKAIDDDIVTLENQIDSYMATMKELQLRHKNPAPIVAKMRDARIRLSLLKALYKRETDRNATDDVILGVLGMSANNAKETEAPGTIADGRQPKPQNFESAEVETTSDETFEYAGTVNGEVFEDDDVVIDSTWKERDIVIEGKEKVENVQSVIGEHIEVEEDKSGVVGAPVEENRDYTPMNMEKLTENEPVCSEKESCSEDSRTVAGVVLPGRITENVDLPENIVKIQDNPIQDIKTDVQTDSVSDKDVIVVNKDATYEGLKEIFSNITPSDEIIVRKPGQVVEEEVSVSDNVERVEWLADKKDVEYAVTENKCDEGTGDGTVLSCEQENGPKDEYVPPFTPDDYEEAVCMSKKDMTFDPESGEMIINVDRFDGERDYWIPERENDKRSVEYDVVYCQPDNENEFVSSSSEDAKDFDFPAYEAFYPEKMKIYASFDLSEYTGMINTDTVWGIFNTKDKTLELTFRDIRDYSIFKALLKEKNDRESFWKDFLRAIFWPVVPFLKKTEKYIYECY